MQLLSEVNDVFVKIVIDDHSNNVHISLAHVSRDIARILFSPIWSIFLFFSLFHYRAKPLKTNVIYNFTNRN